eukprot:TRINITY_DN819_c0_g1_i1.p1 TRINITY_DN819_c0_g1~~TRINITY_DN819_c0_g1_i1.p1  ORF type:complete len:206 (+),score=51.78 TRINITY_DN819_c0_g1_i1:58-675(+)
MVFGFIIHSSNSSGLTYFSHFYDAEGNDSKKCQRLDAIVKIVEDQIETRSKRNQSTRKPEKNIEEEGVLYIPESDLFSTPKIVMWYQFNLVAYSMICEEGVLYIPESDLFSTPKIVMWYQFNLVAYSMICEEDDNRALVASTLPLLARVISDSKKTSQGPSSELLLHPEEVFAILQSYLPNGQLLFISANFAKHVKKEVDAIILK